MPAQATVLQAPAAHGSNIGVWVLVVQA